MHPYFSVEVFKKAYSRIIEPLGDKSYWPQVELPWQLGVPLPKKTNGRNRKLRIKSCLEGGGKSKTKTVSTDNDPGKRVLVRGKRRCKGCGEFGHVQTSYKCSLNGTKKRQVCLTHNTVLKNTSCQLNA